MEKYIEIRTGHEHKIIDNQNTTDESLMMYPAYKAAYTALNGIIKVSDEWHKNGQSDSMYGFSNNTIAFDGKRGQGKTSAMLSFANALGTYASSDQTSSSKIRKYLEDENSQNRRVFHVVPPIDPTVLDEGERIVNLILSHLLREINDIWNGHWRADETRNGRWGTDEIARDYDSNLLFSDAKKQEIVRKVQQCTQHLTKDSKKHENGDLHRLQDVDNAFSLKTNLHDVILYYFQIKRWDKSRSFLVIQIDDTDMQLTNAFRVLEDIRCYLSMPNVVVLLASYLWQLRVIVAQHYAEDMKTALSLQYTNSDKVFRIAAKYLDKLIPAANAIHLPTMRQQREIGTLYLIRDGHEKEELELAFFTTIFERTGLAFVRHKTLMHRIFPSTLRGLVHLYRLINDMPIPQLNLDPSSPQQSYWSERCSYEEQRLINLETFESYFLSDWCPNKLPESKQKIIDRIQNATPDNRLRLAVRQIQRMNASVNPSVSDQGLLEAAKTISASINKRCVFYRAAKELSVSNGKNDNPKDKALLEASLYAELLQELDQYGEKNKDEDDYQFLFAVRCYFSIHFNKMRACKYITLCTKFENNRAHPLNANFTSFDADEINFSAFLGYKSSDGKFDILKNVVDNCSYYGELKAYQLPAYICGLIEYLWSKEGLVKSVVGSDSAQEFTTAEIIAVNDMLMYVICNEDVLYDLYHNGLSSKDPKDQTPKAYIDAWKTYLNCEKGTTGNPLYSTSAKQVIKSSLGIQSVSDILLRIINDIDRCQRRSE